MYRQKIQLRIITLLFFIMAFSGRVKSQVKNSKDDNEDS